MNKSDITSTQRSTESGMTLIEVIMSTLILGVVLAALGQGLTLGIRMNTESKNRLSNLNICKQVMERVKSQIQYDPTAFDGANSNANFNRSFNVDADGNELSSTRAAESAFLVTTVVNDWTDSGGNTLSSTAGAVLVKVLTVTVDGRQSTVSSRGSNTVLTAEMARPAQ